VSSPSIYLVLCRQDLLQMPLNAEIVYGISQHSLPNLNTGGGNSCWQRRTFPSTKSLMGKRKRPGPKALTQEEIWDDSALIRSWDDAVAEYEVCSNDDSDSEYRSTCKDADMRLSSTTVFMPRVRT